MIQKSVFIILFVFAIAPVVHAEFTSIYDYLQKVDKRYYLVVGLEGKGGDSFAAADVAIGIKKHTTGSVDIPTAIEDEVSKNVNKILIGHPCDNGLIPISCDEWPYKDGEALVKVIGNDLIVAGSTVKDTMRAGEMLVDYPKYPILKKELSVIITGNLKKPALSQVHKDKLGSDFVCGDLKCEPGEFVHCLIDCADITCSRLCGDEGFANAFCRQKKSNPNVETCLQGEVDKGEGYCATGNVCCCEEKKITKTVETKQNTEEKKPTTSSSARSVNDIGLFIVLGILIIVCILVGKLLLRDKRLKIK